MKGILKKTVMVSIFFLILFTGYSSFSNMLTQVHQEEGIPSLGPFLLGVNYTLFMISNIFAPGIRLPYKKQMLIASLCYSFNYSTGFFLTYLNITLKYILTAFGATFAGIAAGMLWTSVGGYMHQLCQSYHKREQKGKYFGIFSGIYCVMSILGALLTTFGLGFFSHQTYFLILAGVGLMSFFFCLFFVEQVERSSQIQPFNALKRFSDTFAFYPKMKLVLPLILVDGFTIGITTASLTHLIPPVQDESQKNLRAGFCFISYGFGSVFGGYVSGYFCDKFSLKFSSYANIIIDLITCGITLAGILLENYAIIIISFFLWGFSLYYNEGWMMIMCSRFFKGALQSFAITKQFHGLIYVLYQIYIIATGNKIDFRYVLPVFVFFLIPMGIGLHFFNKQAQLVQLKLKQEVPIKQQTKESLLQSQSGKTSNQ